MKMLSKFMSSPGRTENFPPPLMRFLRSNTGSGSRCKSRGRFRSSPMFIRKKNAAIETQEPSSPKVTCIGQVRIHRPSKQSGAGIGGRNKDSSTRVPCSCGWVQKALFCHHFPTRLRPRSIRRVWHNCDWIFPFGYCRRTKNGDDDSLKTESNLKRNYKASDRGDEGGVEEDEAQAKVVSMEDFNSCSPPKNALLLTRCGSAPYRSSSLASRFWESPLTTSETEDSNGENRALHHHRIKERRPSSESEPTCRDSISEWEIDRVRKGNLGVVRDFVGEVINGRTKELESGEGGSHSGGGGARPRLLRRCKSEPARTGKKLNPESSSWRNRRLGFVEPRSPFVSEKSID
ncbi:hypothetical protein U1Q18_013175 [Sarracenia purpurea var. burkii]